MHGTSFLSARRLVSLAAFAGASLAASTAASQPLVYYGGRVISNVEVVQVSWTNGVDPAYSQQLGTFYQAVLASTYLDWLTEYDTLGKVGYADGLPGSEQHIGRGTFGGASVITPQNGNTTIDDKEIGVELAAQIDSGALPPPKLDANGNVDSLYMIDFPPGITITLVGYQSCQYFGGYHSTISHQGKSIPYAVMPECGYDFNYGTFVRTHELVEAITDTEPGLLEDMFAPTVRPVAWVEDKNSFWEALECADICQQLTGQIAGYEVATNWSNFAGACVVDIPICGGLNLPPACRPCNPFDSGVACNGDTPACATAGRSVGECVLCTSAYSAACTGATPVCDDATYTCVGCLTNADCQDPAAPVCQQDTKTCRGCEADSECGDSGLCDLADDAQKGQCVDCNADSDCAADQHCEEHACAANPIDTTTGSGGDGGGGDGGGGDGGGGSLDLDDAGCACRAGAGNAGSAGGGREALLAGLIAAAFLRRRRRLEC